MNIGSLTGEITLVDTMTAVMAKLDTVLKVVDDSARKTAGGIGQLEKSMFGMEIAAEAAGNILSNTVIGTLRQLPQIAFGAARETEGAMATIARSTGKSGEALQDLVASWKNVHRTVPDSAQAVAQSIAEISRQTGATGEDLEDLTKQMLAFANVNRVDVAEASKLVITAMRATDVPLSQLSSVMDKLTFSAQQSGISVTDLSQGLIRGGVAFKEMGFELDNALALFTNFGKVGANVNDVVGSVSRAMSKLAEMGVRDLKAGMQAVIQQIKDARDFSEAVTIAEGIFGKHGGQGRRLVEEIRFGTFDIGPMVEQLQQVEGLAGRTEKATQTLDERIAVLTKRFQELTVPVGEFGMQLANTAIPHLETGAQLALDFGSSMKVVATEANLVPGPVIAIGAAIIGATGAVWGLNTAIVALTKIGLVNALKTVVGWLAAPANSLLWAFRVVQSQIAIFGVSTGILSSRFLILSKAGAAVMAFLTGPAGMVALFTALTASLLKVVGAVDRFVAHMEEGRDALQFFTVKDDNNFVRKVLGWLGVLDDIDSAMRTIGEYATSVWQTIGKWIEWAANTGLGQFHKQFSELVTKIAGWTVILGGEAIWKLFGAAVEVVSKAFNVFTELAGALWQKLNENPIGQQAGLFGTLTGNIETLAAVIKTVLIFVLEDLHRKFQPIIDAVKWLNENIPNLPKLTPPESQELPGVAVGRETFDRRFFGFGRSRSFPGFAGVPQEERTGAVGMVTGRGAIAPGKFELPDPEAAKKLEEYRKKVSDLATELRSGDQSLKVFRDAFKTLKPEALANFEVQERLVPQILKLVEANQAISPAMQQVITSYQKTRMELVAKDMAMLKSSEVTIQSLEAMERAGLDEAEIAQSLGVKRVESLKLYREELQKTASAVEGVATMEEALRDQQRATAARDLQLQQAKSRALVAVTKERVELERSLTESHTQAQIRQIQEETAARIVAFDEAKMLTAELHAELLKIEKIKINQILSEEALEQLDRFKKSIGDSRVLLERLKDTAVAVFGNMSNAILEMVARADITGMIRRLMQQVQQAATGGGWEAAGEQLRKGLEDVLVGIPQTLVNAFTGGGDIWGAVKGIGTQIGSVIGKSVATALSFTGPIGQAIGAAIGSLIGPLMEGIKRLFSGRPAHEDIARRVAGWAGPISEGLSKAIAEVAKTEFGGDRARAEVFSLDKIIGEVGVNAENVDDFLGKLRDSLVFFADGSFTAAQAVEVLDKNFANLLEHSTDKAGNWSAQIKEIIDLADQLGLESKAIEEAQRAQAQIVAETFNIIIAGAGDALKAYADIKKRVDETTEAVKRGTATQADLTKVLNEQFKAAEAAKQELADFGQLAVGAFATAMEHGASFVEAILAIAPGLHDLGEAYRNLGMDAEDPFVKMLLVQEQVISNAPHLLKGIAGLAPHLVALNNLNMLNAESFQSVGRIAFNAYTRLQAEVAKAGGTTRDALLPMQEFLQQAAAKAKELGIPLDDNTQMLIDQSKELGIWKEAGLSATEKMTASTDKLTTAIDRLTNALLGIPTDLPNPFANWEIPEPPDLNRQRPGEGPGEYHPPGPDQPTAFGGGAPATSAASSGAFDATNTRVRPPLPGTPGPLGESESGGTKEIKTEHSHHYYFLGIREGSDIEELLDEMTARLPEEARANARNHFGTRMRAALELK